MTTPLVLDAIEHAIWTRLREGIADLSGLIHHNDCGPQYVSIAFTDSLIEEGLDASIGATGSNFHNALAETINGLYKTELIKPRGPWRTVEHVEIATLKWVDWFNHRRLYEHCGDVQPVELEAFYYGEHRTTRIAEFSNQQVMYPESSDSPVRFNGLEPVDCPRRAHRASVQNPDKAPR